MLSLIILLLLFLGEHEDPYAIILKHEKERHEAIIDLRSDLDHADDDLTILTRGLTGKSLYFKM